MKYEYNLFYMRHKIDIAKKTNPDRKVGDEVILVEELNRLGADGWDLQPVSDITFLGKRILNETA